MSKHLEIKKELLEGAAESQRKNGLIPTVRDNEKIIVDVLEKVDQQEPIKNPNPSNNVPREKIGEWDHTKTPIVDKPEPEQRPLTMLEKRLLIERSLLDKRVKDLRSKPEWKKKVEACVALMMVASTQEQHLAARSKLVDVLEASNKVFGDWRKMPAQTLYFTGN